MSLINDMLRDLERRRAAESRAGHADTTIVAPPRRTIEKRTYVTLVAGGVVLAAVAALVVTLIDRPGRNPSFAVEKTPQSVSEGIYVAAPPVVAMPSEQPPAPVVSGRRQLSTVTFSDQTEGILLELVFNQSPEPARISASDDKTKILVRLENVVVPDGFMLRQPDDGRLVGLNLELTREGVDLVVYISPHQRVIATQAIEPLADKLLLMLTFPQADEGSAGKTDVAQMPAIPVQTVGPAAVSSVEIDLPQPAFAAPVPVAVVRRPPPLPADQQAYQQGLNYLSVDQRAAIDSFSTALHHNPGLLPARLELTRLLLQQGEGGRAEQVLLEGLALMPEQPVLRKLYTRRLLIGQRYDEAVSLLTNSPVPAVVEDPEYHALLAAAYQEQGHYSLAAHTYTRLVQHAPREALWWFGLATSLEQQGLTAGARDAYRTALDVKGLRPDLEQFIHDRLRLM